MLAEFANDLDEAVTLQTKCFGALGACAVIGDGATTDEPANPEVSAPAGVVDTATEVPMTASTDIRGISVLDQIRDPAPVLSRLIDIVVSPPLVVVVSQTQITRIWNPFGKVGAIEIRSELPWPRPDSVSEEEHVHRCTDQWRCPVLVEHGPPARHS